ncbi:hypothetical protein FKM82_004647 [Ascaphus truei]
MESKLFFHSQSTWAICIYLHLIVYYIDLYILKPHLASYILYVHLCDNRMGHINMHCANRGQLLDLHMSSTLNFCPTICSHKSI